MSIVFQSVDFEWPNGHSLIKNLNLVLDPRKKFGLIGTNGSGKSTLARIIRGELDPSSGIVHRNLRTDYFPQSENPPDLLVSDYLEELWASLLPEETEVAAALWNGIPIERNCRVLSGGEWTRVRLLKCLSGGADLIILDEPTNHLDREARNSILDFVNATSRGLLVISHDRELLDRMDSILELSNQGLSIYGGSWSFYEAERERERGRLSSLLEKAKDERDHARRMRTEKVDAQEKRMRKGRQSIFDSGLPKILLGARKRRAEQTLGKLQKSVDREVESRALDARQAFESLKIEQGIYADFPETSVPFGKLVLDAREFNFRYADADRFFWHTPLTLVMKGPERVRITGANGSGKSTFLRLLMEGGRSGEEVVGQLKLGEVTFGFLDQHGSSLKSDQTVFENTLESSLKSEKEIRNLLAQFLFPGKKADQVVNSLSGGERLRASLAKIMIADPAPQLLILDEPTNNLDLVNLEFLEKALSKFEGAMIVVSHDSVFLGRIGAVREWSLG